MKDYLQYQSLYKNLKDFIMLLIGGILIILAVLYIFFIKREQVSTQDIVIIIGYIMAFIAGKKSKNG